jgi:hypothetical protein
MTNATLMRRHNADLITDSNAAEWYAKYRGENAWGVGNEVPLATFVAGSKDVANYPYETKVTMTKVNVQTGSKYGSHKFPSITAAAYSESYPVTIDQDKNCDISYTSSYPHQYEVLTDNVTITKDGAAVASKYIFSAE